MKGTGIYEKLDLKAAAKWFLEWMEKEGDAGAKEVVGASKVSDN
jgi:hypothetical protein